jgi:hypothetical protein
MFNNFREFVCMSPHDGQQDRNMFRQIEQKRIKEDKNS